MRAGHRAGHEHFVDPAATMGKHVIEASDGPGFLVNRCGRPLASEALRLLQERLASVEEIDATYRRGGGYRMGPFELMDLVGIDVGLAVAQSVTELLAQGIDRARTRARVRPRAGDDG